MKTRKQVLADFYDMQKQLFAEHGHESVTIHTYNQEESEYWSVELQVSHLDRITNNHDLWERVEWNHHTYHNDADEQENLAKVAEFKGKFGLR